MDGPAPIGVFDSGLGGLTVLKALREALPAEDFVYLGDTARLPYGSKSPEVIQKYSLKCLEFLSSWKVKCAVIACNTASSVGLPVFQALPSGAVLAGPVFGVIEPGVQSCLEVCEDRPVLVLATASSVASGAYSKGLLAKRPRLRICEVAAPLLVGLVEEGWWDGEIAQAVVRKYLDQARAVVGTEDPEFFGTVVLGCTHFPLLEKAFRAVLPASVRLVHGAEKLAVGVSTYLDQVGQKAEASLLGQNKRGSVRFFSTDRVTRDKVLLARLFPELAAMELVDLY